MSWVLREGSGTLYEVTNPKRELMLRVRSSCHRLSADYFQECKHKSSHIVNKSILLSRMCCYTAYTAEAIKLPRLSSQKRPPKDKDTEYGGLHDHTGSNSST